MSISDVRTQLANLVGMLNERVTIVRNSQPEAVLIAYDDYRSMQALLRLARNPMRLTQTLQDHQRFQEQGGAELLELEDLLSGGDSPGR